MFKVWAYTLTRFVLCKFVYGLPDLEHLHSHSQAACPQLALDALQVLQTHLALLRATQHEVLEIARRQLGVII